jgi:cell pole-organizing protein PopZ
VKAAAPSTPAADPNNQDDIDALLADFEADNTSGDMNSASAEAEEEILDLTESMAVSKEPSFQTIEPEDDLEFSEDANAMAASMPAASRMEVETRPPAVSFEAAAAPAVPGRPLLSATTISAVDSAFNTLAHTVLSQNARTLEDLVREMLRPMLKSWLDDNLPGLVERLVKAEIERVARGR